MQTAQIVRILLGGRWVCAWFCSIAFFSLVSWPLCCSPGSVHSFPIPIVPLFRTCPSEPPPRLELVASLRGFLVELIELSHSAGKCPLDPLPAGANPEEEEFRAAMRGLFGAEGGPPDDIVKSSSRRVPKRGAGASSDPFVSVTFALEKSGGKASGATPADAQGAGAGAGTGTGAGAGAGMISPASGTPPASKGSGSDANHDDGSRSAPDGSEEKGGVGEPGLVQVNGVLPAAPNASVSRLPPGGLEGPTCAGADGEATATATASTPAAAGCDAPGHGAGGGQGGRSAVDERRRQRTWETPEQARQRLRYRLKMVERRLCYTMAVPPNPPRRSVADSWLIAASKMARAAGLATMHGRALKAEEAVAGGAPGVTW